MGYLRRMSLDLESVGIRVISRWIFNCYLIEDRGDGGAVAVDAGLPSNARSVLDALAGSTGRSVEDLALVVATHTHSDHVGGIPVLAESASPALHLPAKAEDYAKGDVPRSPGPAAMARIWPILLDQPFDASGLREFVDAAKEMGFGQGPYKMPVEPAGFLGDGDSLPGSESWLVIQTPGHTDDSTCFYNPRTKVLLSGDTVLTAGGRAWFNPEYVDDELSTETEARLRDLDVNVLLPGHGRPLVGWDLMSDALSHRDNIPNPLGFALGALRDQVVR